MNNLKERVTIYEVAKASGVSLATVSRVINKQGNVTESTRKKVEETIKKLGYKPSGLAQALATNRTTNIGVVIPSANYVYISNMLNGITDVAKEKGFVLTLFVTSHSHDDAISMVEKVITSHVDGAIIFDDELDIDDIEKINSYSVPTIVINNKITGDRVGCINFSYENTLKKILTNYYSNSGDKLAFFLHVHNAGRLFTRIEKSFISLHDSLNKPYRIFNVDDSYTRTYSDFLEFFKKTKSGYFIAARDSIAAAIANAATDSGLSVPNDVEVLSVIGTKYATIIRPTISSLSLDMQEVGKRAMYMLIDLSNHELLEKTYRFESKYIKRNSTKE
ncbi:MAG: LacI family DNA-binding transcriptional regulator [Bacilli bacterium]|jgi:LacI family transcriptional regulator